MTLLDDMYHYVLVELCGWCGRELPPASDIDDDFECSCGATNWIPDELFERQENDSYGRPDRDKGGRLDWGPPGRYRSFPARSGFPFDHRFPSSK